MKKLIIVIIALFLVVNANFGESVSDESFRFRIIANSDTEEDQNLKKIIKDRIYDEVLVETQNATTLEHTKEIVSGSIPEIETILNEYDVSYNISYGDNYFPQKSYDGVTYESGTYDSMVIELGEASGENWWCILFPPLCLVDAEENETEEVEYESYIGKLFRKLF